MARGAMLRELLTAALMVPGVACAAFSSEQIGQDAGITSMLLQPPAAFLGLEPASLMLSIPYNATRLGFAMSYSASGLETERAESSATSLEQARRLSATAVGEYAINKNIGVFGKYGLRYQPPAEQTQLPRAGDPGYASQWGYRYGVGLNVRASEVLSLHFEWQRHAGEGEASFESPANPAWDPWKERSVLGAGVRLGL